MSEYVSDDDYEEYLFENDNLYEPEEESLTRYNIILCELYNSKIHGCMVNNDKEENIGYLVYCRFKNLDTELIEGIGNELVNAYHFIRNTQHNVYRNYRNIITSPEYFKPEIAMCIYLESQHCVAILKTFWIRLIQRKWKKVFAERQRVLKERCKLMSIKYREINGKWPNSCGYFPSLKGMLF